MYFKKKIRERTVDPIAMLRSAPCLERTDARVYVKKHVNAVLNLVSMSAYYVVGQDYYQVMALDS
jgi:hypothetical protein